MSCENTPDSLWKLPGGGIELQISSSSPSSVFENLGPDVTSSLVTDKFGCLQQVWLFGGLTDSFSASVAIFLGPVLYVSVFHRGQGTEPAERLASVIFINLVVCNRSGSFDGLTERFSASVAIFLGSMLYVSVFLRGQGRRTAGRPAWVIFINLVVWSRSGSLVAPELLCRCRHLLGVNAVCIRVSSWARGRTAERLVVWQQVLSQWPPRAFSTSVVSFLGPVLYVPVTEIVERHPWASFWQKGQICRTSSLGDMDELGCLQQALS